MDSIIFVYFTVLIVFGFILIFIYIFYHYKYTGDIIDLLKNQSFQELSNKINQLVLTGGKMPFKGTLEAKSFGKAWKEFAQLKVTKISGKLYKLQYFYKILRLFFIILAFSFIIPILILIINTFIK